MEEKVSLSWIEKIMRAKVQHFDREKYWKCRNAAVNFSGGVLKKLYCYWCLLYVKRQDAFNCASLGTHLGYGARFENMPSFPHGLNGIIVSHNARFGKNCIIYHQVTVGESDEYVNGAPTIGDNVLIGAGAKILGSITIGNNVKIGPNCVVYKDVPSDMTVVSNNMHIMDKKVNGL